MVIPLNEISRNLSQNVITLRQKRTLTQARLAELSGATRASIALIESGSSNPTMEVLLKLSRALQVSMDELLSPPRAECNLITSEEVPVQKPRKGMKIRKILPEKEGPTQIDEIILDPGAGFAGTPHVEGTREFFTCLSGQFTIAVMGEIFQVKAGDVLNFPGDKPHSYKNSGRSDARGFSMVLLQR
ncbi:MAG: helix-turn-helix domain-containing protein [Bacteriovoracaceae bacterium]